MVVALRYGQNDTNSLFSSSLQKRRYVRYVFVKLWLSNGAIEIFLARDSETVHNMEQTNFEQRGADTSSAPELLLAGSDKVCWGARTSITERLIRDAVSFALHSDRTVCLPRCV